jgi:CubicO group peptidase (beta-lactamase class C family)
VDVELLVETIRRHAAGSRPSFTAAQVFVLLDGQPAADLVHGVQQAYADAAGTPFPNAAAVTADTRFDLASITKLFTAAIVLEVLADHDLTIETPVAEVLPAYREDSRRDIRFRHLLTHTAGLPPVWLGWQEGPTPEQARRRLLTVRPGAAPDEAHVYSCVGYIHAGFAAEELTGQRLDELLAERISGPLGMAATGFTPAPGTPTAATEWQERPVPGMTRGVVHDETARALGGIAGNAGVFSTAHDLARFGEALRTGEGGVLRESTRELMTRRVAPAGINPAYEQAAGPRIADAANFGRLASGACGHTGFTGTMLLLHAGRRLTLVTMTNWVHPCRDLTDPGAFRRDVAGILASRGAVA